MKKIIVRSRQIRVMDMTKEQLVRLIERREKQLMFAKALLIAKFPPEV